MSHVNESCHMWMSHVTCEWVMSHVNESCHMWMSHVTHLNKASCVWCITYVWVMSHVEESCHMWMGHVTCEWAMLQKPISDQCNRSSQSNAPCHVSISHVTYQMSHVTYQRVMWQRPIWGQGDELCCMYFESHVFWVTCVLSHVTETNLRPRRYFMSAA